LILAPPALAKAPSRRVTPTREGLKILIPI
jgi:hypothetical protein